ncbi:helix-turn-helix transcriptional regulator [Croceibacterium sp. TMG7-5b_MA50]|uniref:helix-turn-helix transcriptional regulator n=1 Tax=Croceibacterium sp. TMG7-5b_MA50 TaxID=3121290 RepID=UPI0032221D88
MDALTDKQREVLDLLIAHKTSKEIARELGISHHTVDQRIQFAKTKLGVESRGEVAVAYRALLDGMANGHGETSGPPTYEEPRIVVVPSPVDIGGANDAAPPAPPAPAPAGEGSPADHRVAPDLFEGQGGTIMRLGAIAVLAVLLVFVVLGAVMMYDQLSRSMATPPPPSASVR